MRLSRNVASTRVVLVDGHTGPAAAGKVIESFGHFLIGGNFAAGLIVFAILVVITSRRHQGRRAHRRGWRALHAGCDAVQADGPDAELNASMIDEGEARRRRAEVAEEADFFGSMDGASKFVRGDAVAGMLILFINIVGGFVIGMAQHDLSASQAASSYILLAVGDALVAQVHALLISVAAAMVVSRVGNEHAIGAQIGKQLFDSPKALLITAGIVGALGLVPGMPHFVFMLIASGIGALAWWVRRRQQAETVSAARPREPEVVPPNAEASWDDLVPVPGRLCTSATTWS